MQRGAVVIGCGPSLAAVDIGAFQDLPTISFNRSYVAYGHWGFAPWFYACIDRQALPDNAPEIRALVASSAIRRFFLRDSARALGFADSDRVTLLEVRDEPVFSASLSSVGLFGNVAATSIQILAALGFRRAVLVGIDGRYGPHPGAEPTDRPYHLVSTADNDPNHFRADYHGAGRRFTRPNPRKLLQGWQNLAAALQEVRFEVVNASAGSAVDCFPRLPLPAALEWLQETRG